MEEMVDQVVVDHLKVIQPLLLVDKVVVETLLQLVLLKVIMGEVEKILLLIY
tara:strand:+ start:225 stop:380 length:156 start_codon:yes stop_codon:yes gene_type:complete